MTQPTETAEARPLYVIAREIRADWKNVYFGAEPYLGALEQLQCIHDAYGNDDAETIIQYFLSNAKTWRGDVARRIKAELKAMVP
jgi:hypothetical protein